MEKPLISVLMAAYNAEKYLTLAIESILNQTFQDFEFIIINDGSSDRTESILTTFALKDKRIKCFLNEGGKGLVQALNFGLSKVSSDVVARMDADDISHKDRLQKQWDFLQRNTEVILLGTWFNIFDGQKILTTVRHPVNPVVCSWGFSWNTKVGHPTVMFRKNEILKLGSYPQMRAEDYALFSKVSTRWRTQNLGLALVDYRVHTENKSITESHLIADEVYEISDKYFKELKINASLVREYVDFHRPALIPRRKIAAVVFLSFKVCFRISTKLRDQVSFIEALNGVIQVTMQIFILFLRQVYFSLRPKLIQVKKLIIKRKKVRVSPLN